MRDGTLPDDRSLLAQLYREAGFFHIGELQVTTPLALGHYIYPHYILSLIPHGRTAGDFLPCRFL